MRNLSVLVFGTAVGALASLAMPIASSAQPAAAGAERAAASPAGNPQGAGAELFRGALADMPGKQLVVLPLPFPVNTGRKAQVHQHPGSVYVYMLKGKVRLGIEGQEPRVVSAGEGFFEPVGAIHNVSENVGAEPASAVVFMIVPDGAPLVTPVTGHEGH